MNSVVLCDLCKTPLFSDPCKNSNNPTGSALNVSPAGQVSVGADKIKKSEHEGKLSMSKAWKSTSHSFLILCLSECLYICKLPIYLPLLSLPQIRLPCSEVINCPYLTKYLLPCPDFISLSHGYVNSINQQQGRDRSSGLRGRNGVGASCAPIPCISTVFPWGLHPQGRSLAQLRGRKSHILLPQLSLSDPAPGACAVCILSTPHKLRHI